jgi:multimeric flavodoxin WrbA
MPDKDYSATPLAKKLGARPGAEVVVLFTTRRAELERRFPQLKDTLAHADGLWVAWPKKASRLETDLDFDAVQRVGLDAGLVDNKSAAIDGDWQAVRFVYRLEDREPAPRG